MLTDREILILIYKALAALTYEVTGKPLSMDIETKNGVVQIAEFPPIAAERSQ